MLRKTNNAVSSRALVPLFQAPSPQTVKYALHPPRINPAYVEIPVAEFASSEKFQWVDSLVGDPALLKAIQQDSKYNKYILPCVERSLVFPLDSLVICETGKETGKGVFLSLDAKAIPTGTVIGVYAGHLYDTYTDREGDDSLYRVSAREDEHQYSILSEIFLSPSIDARKYGNLTRYFQDLPEIPNLAQHNVVTKEGANSAILQKKARNNIATANLLIFPSVYRGVPVSFLFASTDIQPGDQLGWDYGERFSFGKKCVFNTDGIIIGHYTNANTILVENTQALKVMNDKPQLDLNKIKQAIENFAQNVVDEKEVKNSGSGRVLSLLFRSTGKTSSQEIQAQATELKAKFPNLSSRAAGR